MENLKGPDFITLLVSDLEISRHFYNEVISFKTSPEVRPNAVAFATKPIGFAIRKSTTSLDVKVQPGVGVLLWFLADDAALLCKQLKAKNVPITQDLVDGPFGKMFTFCDPDGYLITVHDGG
jgi:predicted enzyme related to lactoylglutathione lyase